MSFLWVIVAAAAPLTAPEGDSPQALVDALARGDTATWREAAARLGGSGTDGLDRLAARASAIEGPRLKVALGRLLARSVTWSDVTARPALAKLVRSDIEKGLELAARLEAGPQIVTGHCPDNFRVKPAAPEPPTDMELLACLGAFGVAGVEQLLDSAKPISRARGIELSSVFPRLEERVEALSNDPGHYRFYDCDYGGTKSVADAAKQRIFTRELRKGYPPGFKFEENAAAHYDLINAAREVPGANDATTERDWWNLIRPVWRIWWDLSGTGECPPDREGWFNALRRRDGFLLDRVSTPAAGALRIMGPSGLRVRIGDGGTVQLPFTLPDATRFNRVDVVATRPDGGTTKAAISCCRDVSVTLTLLP